MSVEVYYFSGTGNSLFAAREIAQRINGKLMSIPAAMAQERIRPKTDAIGIVFPVYYATNDRGIPLIINRFVHKLDNLKSTYVFAVCTSGNMPGTTIENLAKLIEAQGGKLAAGFNIKMNNKILPQGKQEKNVAAQKKKLIIICEYILARKTGKSETRGILRKMALAPLLYLAFKPAFLRRYRKLSGSPDLPFSELVSLADSSFKVDEKCGGCGTCAAVCPVGNIKIVDGRPVWQHHCETCLACYSWCPQDAIGGDIVSYNAKYHHQSVKLSDMLRTKQ